MRNITVAWTINRFIEAGPACKHSGKEMRELLHALREETQVCICAYIAELYCGGVCDAIEIGSRGTFFRYFERMRVFYFPGA